MKKLASKIEKKSGCIAATLQIVGDRWTGLILRDLYTSKKRFAQLERSLTGISPRTLSQRLDKLARAKIITKKAYSEVPPRVEYALTKKGSDLVPVLQAMANWGDKYTY